MGGRPRRLRQLEKDEIRESRLGRRMPRAELLWLVCYLAHGQRGQTVKDGADELLTGYSLGQKVKVTFIQPIE